MKQTKWSRWSKEEDKILVEFYSNTPTRDIRTKLLPHRTDIAIRNKAEVLGLSKNIGSNTKYTLNHNYFNHPSLENSYWAGFIAADGNLFYRQGCYRLTIGLCTKDRSVLESFIKSVNFNGPITDRIDSKGYKISTIHICQARNWFKELDNHWSITPKKSLTLKPPMNLSDENLILSYILGYFDGDGSVGYYPRLQATIVGTYDVLEWIKYYVDLIAGQAKGKIRWSGTNKTHHRYTICGKRAKIFFNRLYQLNVPYMKRKQQKFNGITNNTTSAAKVFSG